MAYTITILEAAPRLLIAAKGSGRMLSLLDKVWDFVRRTGLKTDGQNVAIYRGSTIEAGAGVSEKFEGNGELSCIATPSGRAATAIHMGPYQLLGQAHSAIRDWCAANGHTIEGTNWEIYGHHEEDPAKQRTDIFYLLRS